MINQDQKIFNKNQHLAWVIWALAAFFFFSHYVVRVTPGQIIEDLQLAFINTSATQIGILGAAFYLPYVLMQMPVGYLVDKFGPRALLSVAVLLCAVSSLIFATAISINTAMISRIILGFCSATAFVGAIKLITVWFDSKKLALLVGITQALGMLGASFGTAIVPKANYYLGWQTLFFIYAGVFISLSLLMVLFIRNQPNKELKNSQLSHKVINKNNKTDNSSLNFKSVILNKYTWINALFCGLLYAPSDVMGELWGTQFIKNIHDVSQQQAASSVSFLFIGWAIGAPIAGFIADKIGRKKVMLISAIMGFILLPLIFFLNNLSFIQLSSLMFLYGLTNTGLIAAYATAGQLHSKNIAGFSIAIANMLSVLIGALLMPLVGYILTKLATNVSGEIIFLKEHYQTVSILLPCCMLMAIILAIFNKETLQSK